MCHKTNQNWNLEDINLYFKHCNELTINSKLWLQMQKKHFFIFIWHLKLNILDYNQTTLKDYIENNFLPC